VSVDLNQTMDIPACISRIAADLGRLGIGSGDTILVHSSCRSLGPVPGGIETVVEGLLTAVGASGTLLMPALCWNLRPPAVFDPRTTPGIVGAIPEFFRTRPGTHRSIHPTHSVCAVGRRAHELLDGHGLDDTPCGAHSPFNGFVAVRGKIVMLGCGLRPNTTMHALEECVRPPYLFGQVVRFSIRDWDGSMYQKDHTTHGFDGYQQRYDRVAELPGPAFIRSGCVLAAETSVLEAAPLKEAVVAKLGQDPLFFVDRAP
jgi:aminoglycoside 3-N-acetyltransferase